LGEFKGTSFSPPSEGVVLFFAVILYYVIFPCWHYQEKGFFHFLLSRTTKMVGKGGNKWENNMGGGIIPSRSHD